MAVEALPYGGGYPGYPGYAPPYAQYQDPFATDPMFMGPPPITATSVYNPTLMAPGAGFIGNQQPPKKEGFNLFKFGGNVLKGVVKPLVDFVTDPKKLLIGALAIGATFIPVVGPFVAAGLIAYGVYNTAKSAAKFGSEFYAGASTGDWQRVNNSGYYLGNTILNGVTTYAGARANVGRLQGVAAQRGVTLSSNPITANLQGIRMAPGAIRANLTTGHWSAVPIRVPNGQGGYTTQWQVPKANVTDIAQWNRAVNLYNQRVGSGQITSMNPTGGQAGLHRLAWNNSLEVVQGPGNSVTNIAAGNGSFIQAGGAGQWVQGAGNQVWARAQTWPGQVQQLPQQAQNFNWRQQWNNMNLRQQPMNLARGAWNAPGRVFTDTYGTATIPYGPVAMTAGFNPDDPYAGMYYDPMNTGFNATY